MIAQLFVQWPLGANEPRISTIMVNVNEQINFEKYIIIITYCMLLLILFFLQILLI